MHWAARQLPKFVFVLALLIADPRNAQSEQAGNFNITASDLRGALLQFAQQSNLQIVFADEATVGRHAQPLRGTYSPLEALDVLLRGSGLTYSIAQDNTIVVRASTRAPASGTHAAETPENPAQARVGASDQGTTIEQVIVTARRKEESVQDVPGAVTPITSNEIEKFNIRQFEEISELASGLQINGSSISMRGITFSIYSATFAPTTATYLNDAPVLSSEISTAMFDVGQIEVLRGPQGTLHGIATPSGAITFTTRRPDLNQFSADGQITVGSLDSNNVQGAVNVPLVADKLAIRLAALEDLNDANDVESIHSPVTPYQRTEAGRVSIGLEPIDTLSANLMYQHVYAHTVDFTSAVFGPGSPGGTNLNAPAGYNGPMIGEYANLAVADGPNVNSLIVDDLTGQIDWALAGQRLSYVGSWQNYRTDPRLAEGDQGNTLPGYEIQGPRFSSPDQLATHELRLSSQERIAGMFDYVLGAFHQRDSVSVEGDNGVAAYLPGSFGAPGSVPVPGPPNTRYQLDTLISAPRTAYETSIFGNATAHLGGKVELSAGGRKIFSRVNSSTTITTTPAFTAVSLPRASCTQLQGQFGATYPGICDIPIPSQLGIAPVTYSPRGDPWIYEASISYHFDPELMIYAQTASSWRQGPLTIGVNNATDNPTLNTLINHPPETSKSYETGVKWSFLERRGRVNVDYFHQTYDGLIYVSPFPIYYLSYSGAPTPTVGTYAFTSSAPAVVDGFDVDVAMHVTKQWSASGNLSWADSRLGGSIPCNNGRFNGIADSIVPTVAAFQAAGKLVAYCQSSLSPSTAPKWNFNVQSEYDLPVNSLASAFIRGLLNYNARSPSMSQDYVTPAYAVLNLYLGVRDPTHKWEVSLFAKNVSDVFKAVSVGATPVLPPAGLSSVFGSAGYYPITYTQRREFGLNARYAFGP